MIVASTVGQPLSLFGDAAATSVPSQAPRFQVRYHHCEDSGCAGHGGTILDREMTALQWKLRAGSSRWFSSVMSRRSAAQWEMTPVSDAALTLRKRAGGAGCESIYRIVSFDVHDRAE